MSRLRSTACGGDAFGVGLDTGRRRRMLLAVQTNGIPMACPASHICPNPDRRAAFGGKSLTLDGEPGSSGKPERRFS